MGIVAAILGIIIGAFVLAWTQGMFGDGTSKFDEVQTFELVSRLRANVKEGFFGQSTYGSNANLVPTLTAMGKVPGSARSSVTAGSTTTATIVSPYGGNILIVGNGRRFHISVEDIGDEACFNLGKRFSGGAAADFGVVNIEVGSAADTTVNTAAPAVPDLAAIQAACDEGADANHITITFR